MNSVRPLVTITILAGVGWFLFVKINQAPMRPLPGHEHEDDAHAQEGVPPLADKASTLASAAPASPTLAPQWPANSTTSEPSRSTPSEPSRPETPTIPDLPELPKTPIADAPTLTPPVERSPANSADRYGSNASSESTPAGPGLASPASPSVPSASTTSASEHDSAAESAMAAMGLTPQQTTPLASATGSATTSTPAASVDRYGTAASATNSPTTAATSGTDRYGTTTTAAVPTSSVPASAVGSATPPSTSPLGSAAGAPRSFAAAWPTIQSSLQKGELVRAHLLLSPWFGDPSLTPAESQQVEALLAQLAGTVIYSTEHRLEPPYAVRPGETLEDIARQHNVPWQLLGKINNVPAASQLRPGQQLKVVRGPFEGELDLRRNQLLLKVDGRYAGKFSISAPADVSLPPGDWIVQDKPTSPAPQASVYGAPSGGQLAVSRSLLLRSSSATAADPGLPVHIGAGPGPDSMAGSANGLRAAGQPPYLVKVSPRDADELSDILSIGSRVVIRR